MKISVVGAGYVGLSLAILLSQKYEVSLVDVIETKVEKINKRVSPIKDKEIEEFFKNKQLNLTATLNHKESFENADYIIICTPTDYNCKKNQMDTEVVENIIRMIKDYKYTATVIIKSTVPIGFSDEMAQKYDIDNIIYAPEFLREGKALYDNLYPSRIIIGDEHSKSKEFLKIIKSVILKECVEVKIMTRKEAEAVKLFSNTYLAMRVAFFNELDTYAELNGLNSKNIIEGLGKDKRIGDYYNNPSFGYGGYCLPKDSKQLENNYLEIPHKLIEAVNKSNDERKKHIVNMVVKRKPKVVGIYKLAMKKDSDNIRGSAICDIINEIKKENIKVVIYEPIIEKESDFFDCEVYDDFEKFSNSVDIILANRLDDNLIEVEGKVYSRDLFSRD